ncbi:MAG: prepilin peptidase [Nitrospirae bacterium]|nr:MAG: prepilin peptidase [Nitrospirota bacterium]
MYPIWLQFGAIFVIGLVIGSFLTVCVTRIPLGQSIVFPRSRCSSCRTIITWYDNIPLISFLLLRGQCRRCQQPIDPRYPLIELLNGLGYVWLFWHFGWGWPSAIYAGFFSVLLTVTWIDWDHQIIPDVITLPGIVLGWVAATVVLPIGWLDSLIGTLMGGGVLLVMAWVSPYLLGKEGLGGGDIKFLAMIGAFLGWKSALITLFFASVLGASVGVGLLACNMMQRGQYMPFGPFLAVGAFVSMLYGDRVLAWYWGLLL